MEFSRLSAVALVHEDIQITLGLKSWRQGLFHFLNERFNVNLSITVTLATKLVDQGTQEPRRGSIQSRNKVGTTLRAVDVFIDALKHSLDLFIEFGAVRDDKHARVLYVLPDPLREPYHR